MLSGFSLHLHTVIVSLFKFRCPLDITNSDSEDRKAEQRGDFELTGVTRLQGERQEALPKLKKFFNRNYGR